MKINLLLYKKSFLTLLTLFIAFGVAAQNPIVEGTVRDAKTGEALPYVTVSAVGSSHGTTTDMSGYYKLAIEAGMSVIQVSFVGYETITKTIEPDRNQKIDFAMHHDPKLLKDVVIRSGKRKRYSNKNNPAVELIRQVIAHKDSNRMSAFNFTQYQQYEKVYFALSNLSEKFKKWKVLKKYQFLFREQDSTRIGGKNLLPVYLEEKLSDVYYRKDPERHKQVIKGHKRVQFDENFIDNEGLDTYINRMYEHIDIYDNTISLLSNDMLSPIAGSAPAFYKFFITDTIRDQGPPLVVLSFTPRNTADMLFEGALYITLDGHYAVAKANLTVNRNINLNFVRKVDASLDFNRTAQGRYTLRKSDIKIDFGLNKEKGVGVLGERSVTVSDLLVNQPRADSVYSGPEIIVLEDAKKRSSAFWQGGRPDSLSANERDTYHNIDTLQRMPSFRRTMALASMISSGYLNLGAFEIGPINTFYSFNPIEGFKPRFGGRTTPEFSERFYLETYAAYGARDKRFKYFVSGTYSFDKTSIYRFPQNFLRVSYQHDTKIPGQELQFVQENSFLLSFKRGDNRMWLYNDIFRLDYIKEFRNHFSYNLGFKTWTQQPAGVLLFQNMNNGQPTDVRQLRTTEFSLQLRYAPHEKFYQSKRYRRPIFDKYPIFTLQYNQGVRGLFGGAYNYQSITGLVNKRIYWAQFGETDVALEANQIFGKVPFPLLDIHRANQTYTFQLQSYNLMNFLEFVSDHYAAINIDHNFNGFILNKIPLIKKLKLRETINFKALWGGIRSENDPSLHPDLLKLPVNASTNAPLTYSLNNGPYIEGSIGISNIFKVIRLDYVKRFSYLDHPRIAKNGIRLSLKFDF